MKPGTAFQLDERLAAEAAVRADLPLCRLLLRDDAAFPWLILVPRRPDVTESTDLLPAERGRLWAEVETAGAALLGVTGADKLNIAAFGNVCPQMHIHLIARRIGDEAWPDSAVGRPRRPYSEGLPSFWPALLARLDRSARTSP